MGKTRKDKGTPAPKRAHVRMTLRFDADTARRLGVAAVELSDERGRRVDRAELISEWIKPHLAEFVVSRRGRKDGEETPAA